MLSITKIFHFETAHAISGYQGACRNIHGHSYELHMTVCAQQDENQYLPGIGILVDFKIIKQVVTEAIVKPLDHILLLSQAYLDSHPGSENNENLMIFDAEPTAENILLYIKRKIAPLLPEHVQLQRIRLYETKDSYAEWVKD
jgi:6-pyruvoyltetrahydropterin/6-carboxytetrahydropterin synthase